MSAKVGTLGVTLRLGRSPLRHCRKTSMARERASSTLIRGQKPSIIRNCFPETLVVIRKVRLRAFRRTPKPLSTRSRRMRPSVAVTLSSSDSLIITIDIIPPGQNEDKTLR
jgi:hypothetical protein